MQAERITIQCALTDCMSMHDSGAKAGNHCPSAPPVSI
jgi:hypothetical protein